MTRETLDSEVWPRAMIIVANSWGVLIAGVGTPAVREPSGAPHALPLSGRVDRRSAATIPRAFVCGVRARGLPDGPHCNMAAPETITCIYCLKEKPPSREHVFPRSLGGDLTEPLDCLDCNQKVLGPLHQALAERSIVALSRVAYTPRDAFRVQLGGDHFWTDPDSGIVCDVRIENGIRLALMPQTHLLPVPGEPDRFGLGLATQDGPDFERLATFITDAIARGALRDVHVKVGPARAGVTARLVLHREDAAYVRVQHEKDAHVLFEVLESGWAGTVARHREMLASGPLAPTSLERPTANVTIPVPLDKVNRAVASIAFNVVAVRLGAAFARRREFDEFRRYIIGDDVRHPEPAEPEEVAVDGRFVQMLPAETQPMVPTEEHAVTLCRVGPTLHAWVTLYERHQFIVTLGDVAMPDVGPITHEFSAARRGNKALGVEELYRRIRGRVRA